LPKTQAIDTLAIARRKFPGSPASLDALCRRFSIDNSSRTLHGALLDSEILAEVYLELMGGRQPDLVLSESSVKKAADGSAPLDWRPSERLTPLASRLSETEKAAHEKFIATFVTEALWSK
jgi:DNA polymerase-3 subunit epsilon